MADRLASHGDEMGNELVKDTRATGSPSFFERLSGDELCLVTRHLSAQPHSRLWRSHMAPKDLAQLFDRGGPLFPAAGTVVPRVDINGISQPGRLTVSGAEFAKWGLAERLGNAMNELSVCDRPMLGMKLKGDPYAAVSRHCRGLRYLRFEQDASSYDIARLANALASQSATLEVLHLALMEPIDLHFAWGSLVRLRALRLYDVAFEKYVGIFASIGATLEELRVVGPCGDWHALLDDVQENARRLHTIDLDGSALWLPEDRHAALLKSYGAQLRHARLDELDVQSCDEVMDECPNVATSGRLGRGHFVWFDVVVERIDELRITDLTADDELRLLKASCARCKRLTEVASYHLGRESKLMHIFFASPKPALRKVRLSCRVMTLRTELVDALVSSAPDLEDLSINFEHLGEKNNVARIVDGTKSLTDLCVTQGARMDQKDALEYIQAALASVAGRRCVRNVELQLDVSVTDRAAIRSAVREAVQPLRLRRTRVEGGKFRQMLDLVFFQPSQSQSEFAPAIRVVIDLTRTDNVKILYSFSPFDFLRRKSNGEDDFKTYHIYHTDKMQRTCGTTKGLHCLLHCDPHTTCVMVAHVEVKLNVTKATESFDTAQQRKDIFKCLLLTPHLPLYNADIDEGLGGGKDACGISHIA